MSKRVTKALVQQLLEENEGFKQQLEALSRRQQANARVERRRPSTWKNTSMYTTREITEFCNLLRAHGYRPSDWLYEHFGPDGLNAPEAQVGMDELKRYISPSI